LLQLLEQQQPMFENWSQSVGPTWSLNSSGVMRSPASADLLRLSAFLAPEDTPLDLLAPGLAKLAGPLSTAVAGADENPVVLDELLEPLARYSVVRRHPGLQAYSIHRLTQLVIRDRLIDDSERHWAKRAILAVQQVFPGG